MVRMPKGGVRRLVADTPVAIYLTYKGAGTVTSVTVDTATDIEMITTEGTETYAFATYDTVGELADAINAAYNDGFGAGVWSATVADALRTHATASVFITGVITVINDVEGTPFYPVYVDTSASDVVSCSIRGAGFIADNTLRPDSRVVHLNEIVYFATLGAAGANGVSIYERKPNGTETLINSRASISATATTINFAGGNGYISGAPGSEIIVVLSDGTSISDTALVLQVSALIE